MTNNDDDSALFRKAMAADAVAPLKAVSRVALTPKQDKAKVRLQQQHALIETANLRDDLSDEAIQRVAPEAFISCAKAGLQQQQLKKLKAGQIAWETSIDLHGYRLEEARTALVVFLRRCQNKGYKCVKVVHGKGLHRQDNDLTIKSALASWLWQMPTVMGYASCTPTDGGAGAVYVLLKRLKELPDAD